MVSTEAWACSKPKVLKFVQSKLAPTAELREHVGIESENLVWRKQVFKPLQREYQPLSTNK